MTDSHSRADTPTTADWHALFPGAKPSDPPLRIVLHAPSAASLVRARSNLHNLRQKQPQAQVWIVVNSQAVEALFDTAPDTEAFMAQTLVCPNTLQKLGRTALPGWQVLPQGAMESLAMLQASGWAYIRS